MDFRGVGFLNNERNYGKNMMKKKKHLEIEKYPDNFNGEKKVEDKVGKRKKTTIDKKKKKP